MAMFSPLKIPGEKIEKSQKKSSQMEMNTKNITPSPSFVAKSATQENLNLPQMQTSADVHLSADPDLSHPTDPDLSHPTDPDLSHPTAILSHPEEPLIDFNRLSWELDKDCAYIKKWIPELRDVKTIHIHFWDLTGHLYHSGGGGE